MVVQFFKLYFLGSLTASVDIQLLFPSPLPVWTSMPSSLLLQLFLVILVTMYMSFHISLRILIKISKNYFGSFRINVLFYSASLL